MDHAVRTSRSLTAKRSIPFSKYHGAGNDFIIINSEDIYHALGGQESVPIQDLRFGEKNLNQWITTLCHRRFGIGADGLIINLALTIPGSSSYNADTIRSAAPDGVKRYMLYYNADGSRAAFCGNGARCLAMHIHAVTGENRIRFASDRCNSNTLPTEEATILENYSVRIKMGMRKDFIPEVIEPDQAWLITVGVPHLVLRAVNAQSLNHEQLIAKGRMLREQFDANVNFCTPLGGSLFVRTYERGVEDETLSCGSGVTAAAIAFGIENIATRGGVFVVQAASKPTQTDNYSNHAIHLIGPVSHTFTGTIPLRF